MQCTGEGDKNLRFVYEVVPKLPVHLLQEGAETRDHGSDAHLAIVLHSMPAQENPLARRESRRPETYMQDMP